MVTAKTGGSSRPWTKRHSTSIGKLVAKATKTVGTTSAAMAVVITRFRPSFFPFTEPSVEFDASCIFCGGSGIASSGGNCSRCKGSGWIELFGAGMVDPAVYGYVNYDAAKLSGFAFGIGIDRLTMLKYGIDDIQLFFQSDARFLRQFP